MDEKPRLRDDLQPVRARVGDRDVILLRDPLALSSQAIALGGAAVGLLSFFDGTRDVPELRLIAIKMQGGNLDAGDDLENLLGILDERCLLDNDNYRERRRLLMEDWSRQGERSAAFAGAAYPADPSELSRFLDQIVSNAPEPRFVPQGRLVALVAPHVDLEQGWALYGAAYRQLERAGLSPERILLLGTGHSMPEGVLCPTSKHYSTPLGRARTDVAFVEGLGDEPDFVHRGEHSLEFQLVFLQHIYAEELAPIVPILCGPADPHLEQALAPSDLPGVEAALGKMSKAMEQGAVAIAGVDLVHVGPKFGDEEPASALLGEAVEHETALIEALERADAGAFWSIARSASNRYNVCGLSALGLLLEILPDGARGALLGRDVMRDHDTNSAVGYAALAFYA
jgi:AmmeMemoRadiSam system protein B